MDYKAIEAAMARAVAESESIDVRAAEHTAYFLVVSHGDDLLRLVRAMAWMEEQGPTVRDSRGVAAVEVYRDGCKETYFGPTIIEAIEAAMAATDQQTKGATDEA